jgi:hypothetical protein
VKVGDLVRTKAFFSSTPIFSTWGNKAGGDKPIGTIQPGDIGIVLETNQSQGGNGARIMVAEKIGWINIIFLENET